LNTFDLQLELPDEYVALELSQLHAPTWVLGARSAEQAQRFLSACGLNQLQIQRALSPQVSSVTNGQVVIRPDEALIVSLAPEVRARLYGELARQPANQYMVYPFCFSQKCFDQLITGTDVSPDVKSLLRSLTYRRGDSVCFSDLEAVMQHIPAEEQRLRLLKALSRQSAIMARVSVRQDTDIDKLLGYWGQAPGVHLTDLRSLLRSAQRLQDGGSVSLVYLLPTFARERLYTYPPPSSPGDPTLNRHWATFNFFNATPDDRFADPQFAVAYLREHYYPITEPTAYGDLIFVMDDQGHAIHSAVYLADNLVFTKNGSDFMEPWVLMRLKTMLARYSATEPGRWVVYRNKLN
jgi:hypothetical protein